MIQRKSRDIFKAYSPNVRSLLSLEYDENKDHDKKQINCPAEVPDFAKFRPKINIAVINRETGGKYETTTSPIFYGSGSLSDSVVRTPGTACPNCNERAPSNLNDYLYHHCPYSHGEHHPHPKTNPNRIADP
jgi:hypothetical protein